VSGSDAPKYGRHASSPTTKIHSMMTHAIIHAMLVVCTQTHIDPATSLAGSRVIRDRHDTRVHATHSLTRGKVKMERGRNAPSIKKPRNFFERRVSVNLNRVKIISSLPSYNDPHLANTTMDGDGLDPLF
jgi:hypothetical protein